MGVDLRRHAQPFLANFRSNRTTGDWEHRLCCRIGTRQVVLPIRQCAQECEAKLKEEWMLVHGVFCILIKIATPVLRATKQFRRNSGVGGLQLRDVITRTRRKPLVFSTRHEEITGIIDDLEKFQGFARIRDINRPTRDVLVSAKPRNQPIE